ncbi:Integral membrane protein DUF92 [Acholeplasma oculi]|uniref:DUF92 domain-containing protein n=1 Tax=Acholeplasma oculi TaxID=35623 RepID=A0A061A8X4_9MOLU|nr:DUF92 domain-containing protein [Acholeplasma oculi]CDR30335.1 hypothetical protein, DUF92 [Acholeplasma oculi]SKC42572.1 TIGR00297 family protein [Acholeplasma oculi]SUT88822.1 Integral membrane protein DUF92 [Acholeplasma oculi]
MLQRFIIGGLLSLFIGFVSYKKKSLTLSGFIAAFFTGTLLYMFGDYVVYIPLISFFLSSSILSKFKPKKEEPNGRNFIQVFANSGVALVFTVIYYLTTNSIFLVVAITSIAASTADTWGSEIGLLTNGQTYSILTLKKMSKGLSGAVSVGGTLASFMGALYIAIIFSLLYFMMSAQPIWILLEMGMVITLSGFLGSVLDSYLGIFLQAKYKDIKTGILRDYKIYTTDILVSGLKYITNDMVNLLMVIIISVGTYLILLIT